MLKDRGGAAFPRSAPHTGSLRIMVGLGVGAIFGGLASSDASDARSDPTLCPDELCTRAGRDAIDAADGKATVATALFPIGGTLAVAGVVLLIVDATSSSGDSTTTESSAPTAIFVPVFGAGSAGFSLLGSF